jgi:hypothetical protein
MRLSKWHGLGNDYLLVERAELDLPLTPERVRRICDYHFGVGSDGILEFVSAWIRPQELTCNGRHFTLELRPQRFYKPFSLHLVEFRFDRYAGTEIPKNFSSRVRLQRPETGEDREVLIYMNSPLRYEGETFYQADWDKEDEKGTILQVVHNPSWLTPYFACVMVAAGLIFQFLTHLIGFAKKRRPA